MKISEVVSGDNMKVRIKIRDRLAAELNDFAIEFQKHIAELSNVYTRVIEIPWHARTAALPKNPIAILIKSSVSLTSHEWHEGIKAIKDFLEDKGYVGGVLPVKVQILPVDDRNREITIAVE